MVQPKGQESELAGIFMYSAQILAWLPTLVFTILNENDVHMMWGGMSINSFFLIALLMAPWDVCVDVTKKENRLQSEYKSEEKGNEAKIESPVIIYE